MVDFLNRGKKTMFEWGFGTVYSFRSGQGFALAITIGVRVQGKREGCSLFRIALTPFFLFNVPILDGKVSRLLPWGGISVGYSFK
jgi:hypothetical protein